MIQNCYEQLLDDIVKVQLVLAANCDMAIPFQVSGIDVMDGFKTEGGQQVDRIGAAAVSIAYTTTEAEQGELLQAPVLKQQDKRVPAGIIVEHSLEVPVVTDNRELRTAVESCQLQDVHVVLFTAAGDRYLLYAVPGSSSVLLDEQDVAQQFKLKVQLTSMSHVIKLI